MTPDELSRRATLRPLLLDGGLGSMLISMGLAGGKAPELWLSEHADRIADVHRRYRDSGSNILTTCTFGASPAKLRTIGLADQCADLNIRAVEITRTAAGPDTLVAGDIGPTGLMLPPVGQASVDELTDSFTEQALALRAGGADLLLIETMYDLREALLAVRAAVPTGLAVIASMTFSPRKRGFFTVMGDALLPSLEALAGAGACAVGFNCTVTSDIMVEMVPAAVSLAVPVVAQPNAGQPRATASGIVYDSSGDRFADDLKRMVRAGARIVGGCCGTDPEFISKARVALDDAAGSPG